jgi:hypothetical protein
MRCTYTGCERPEESCHFYEIAEGKTSGGQDWSSIAGSVLCNTCYSKFQKSGTLERSRNKPLAASARRCTYAGCERPEKSCQFHQISEDSTAGGQDWSSLTGSVLCEACYSRFRKRGTLEMSSNRKIGTIEMQQRPLPHSKAARADLKPGGQVAAEGGSRAGKRKAACQDDDMRDEAA